MSTPNSNVYAKITKIFFCIRLAPWLPWVKAGAPQPKIRMFMRDDSESYSYQGKTFNSREAMEQFISNRAPVDVRNVVVAPRKSSSFGWVLVVFAAAFLAMCSAMTQSENSTMQAAPSTAPVAGTVALDDDVSHKAALVINAVGQLCAQVTGITRVQGDVYKVACIRYRDGTGTATYEMNAATGAVK
jgi:hypothetical protein